MKIFCAFLLWWCIQGVFWELWNYWKNQHCFLSIGFANESYYKLCFNFDLPDEQLHFWFTQVVRCRYNLDTANRPTARVWSPQDTYVTSNSLIIIFLTLPHATCGHCNWFFPILLYHPLCYNSQYNHKITPVTSKRLIRGVSIVYLHISHVIFKSSSK